MFSCAVTVAALALCHFNHKESHDRIINQNQAFFQSYRATLASLPSRIDTITARKQDVLLDIIEDSLLNNLPKLPRNHQQALRSYVESAVLAASMELPYYSLMGELEESLPALYRLLIYKPKQKLFWSWNLIRYKMNTKHSLCGQVS